MTDIEKGYIAGLIDGEGTISLLKDRADAKFRYPCLEMSSTTFAMLKKLQQIADGGAISSHKTYKSTYKQSWHYKLRGDKAIDLLNEVKDYLLEPKKKYRADLICSTYKQVTPRNGKYSEEMLQKKLQFEEDFFKEDFGREANSVEAVD